MSSEPKLFRITELFCDHSGREVLGPCVGSIICDIYDFPMAMTIFGLLNLSVALLLLLNRSCAAIWRKTENPSNAQLPLSSNGTLDVVQVGLTDHGIITDEEERLISNKDSSQIYGTAC